MDADRETGQAFTHDASARFGLPAPLGSRAHFLKFARKTCFGCTCWSEPCTRRRCCNWVKRFIYLILFVIILGIAGVHLYQIFPWKGKVNGMVVVCKQVKVPGLEGAAPVEQAARICYPVTHDKDIKYPVLLFAHGDGAGGSVFNIMYEDLQQLLAGYGFVVPAYLSCWFDTECENGESSFLQALKTMEYLEDHPNKSFPIDFSKPYSVVGHSTGARVALMLAALRDTWYAGELLPRYLFNTTSLSDQITPRMQSILMQIQAVIAYHPDPMYDDYLNPDMENFNITHTPVMIITGSDDTDIEPEGSAWYDFLMLRIRNKVFVNVHGASHYDKDFAQDSGPFMAYFAKNWSLGNVSAGDEVCGNGSTSLRRTLDLAYPWDDNNGGEGNDTGQVSFLCCNEWDVIESKEYGVYCSEPFSQTFL